MTGEGKTLVATLPAYLNALDGQGVHVVTVNDYLARRDMEWMAPLYMDLGMTVGAIQSDMDSAERQTGLRLRHHLRHEQRIRLRLPARQHEAGTRRSSLSASSQQCKALELRHHRRSRQHPDRRSPHAADHLGPGLRRRRPSTPRPTASPGSSKQRRPLRGQGKGAHLPPDRRGHPRGRANSPASRASTPPATWNGRT